MASKEIDSIEGTVSCIKKIGNMDSSDLTSMLTKPEKVISYTIFELFTHNSETQEIFFPMHLGPSIVMRKIKYWKEDSEYMDTRQKHLIKILEGPNKGLIYDSGFLYLKPL